jgi:glutamate synthase domain-containing protein 2
LKNDPGDVIMEVPDTPENRSSCICPQCPSFPGGACRGDILYCSTGASTCEVRPLGCLCTGCPVYDEYHLTSIYFCDKVEIGETGHRVRKQQATESDALYGSMTGIKIIAETGKGITGAMGSQKHIPFTLDDLHFIPAQVHRIPLNHEDPVAVGVTLGPGTKRPLVLPTPILVSGMSYGAVSKRLKLAIAGASARLGFAFNTGEGGILDEELATAPGTLIMQYSTGRFGITEEKLKKAAAVEIRFGQGAYPGKGSYLPAEKITPGIARIRGVGDGEAAYSPAHHPDMTDLEGIRGKVTWLKSLTGGVPVGAKIGCGNIEEDVTDLAVAGVDFIALDGFGGGTGATDLTVRENVGLPLLAALPRADRELRSLGIRERITLIGGGGLRTSADFAKCLALGADAVYIGTAALIAVNCEQYRICHTGRCPTGVTTQDPVLEEQLDPGKGIERLCNFIRVSTEEMAGFARIAGKHRIQDLDITDLVALKRELSIIVGCSWLGGPGTKE